MSFIRIAPLLLIALTATACTIPLRQAHDETPPAASDPLDTRLERCSALGTKNIEDADCQSAFAEVRKRILPPLMRK